MKNTRLPPHLSAAQEEIENYAREYGLDFFPIIYEVLDYRTLYETASLGGFPTRYPHWRFGMEYDQLLKGHVWLGSTIYEMVINTNPSYAYLLEGNETVTQKMVMAHVCAHVDFFKHNMWFAHTNRKMLDEMANHAARIQRIIERQGYDVVEDFIDTCLSLENLIDYHAPYIKRPDATYQEPLIERENADELVEGLQVEREYMREYINPPDFLDRQRQQAEQERQKQKRFPISPQKDILLFLLNYAPLERWQHAILEFIRDEAYYFAPQGMTKVLNEGWACVVAGSLLYTDRGLLPIEDIVQRQLSAQVADGQGTRRIYDWATFNDKATVFIRTRRGLELEGSVTHRLLLPDGTTWKRLDEMQMGDCVQMSGGGNLWSQEYVTLDWQPVYRLTLQGVADRAGVNLSTVLHYRKGTHASRSSTTLAPLVAEYAAGLGEPALSQQHRPTGKMPQVVDEQLATLLGYLTGDGNISTVKRVIGFISGDEAQADAFVTLVSDLFGLQARKRRDGGRWRVTFSSGVVEDFLKYLGLPTGPAARIKMVPAVILRSPASVVAAFLRALYDCDGYAGEAGIILSTASTAMSQTVQLLLLNFGILSTRRLQQDGCWHVHTTGRSAAVFADTIGFGLAPKQARLRAYVDDHHWFKQEEWHDEIVAIEHRRATVYDISVEQTHRYAAQGLVNHNSFWHSEIMTKRAVLPSEIISFADLHSGVVATSGTRLNPYKLGLELLRDVEERWNTGRFGKEYDECDDLAEKQNWDRQLGLGRQKIFEIRKLYNDVTFIDEFLTPEFALQQKLFTFRYNRDTDIYEIASREFQEIKQKLLFSLTNFGQPYIMVGDANYNNRGELYLLHRYEGVDLQMDYARETMRNLHKIWTRPIHLETVTDNRRRLLSFDGTDYSERRLD
ncbi:MAG: SpoVR family protein [Chloroflexaceae bacterium]|nr:SpoVR family protein [Chloroflexaceae bacterium]